MPGAKPLWALTFVDLALTTRACHALWELGLRKPWHVAALCDACLLRTRNFGQHSFALTREALAQHGFPPPPGRCPQWLESTWDGTAHRYRRTSICWDALEVCRDMLEGLPRP